MEEKGTIYEVVWPRGRRAVKNVSLAKRLDKLEGATVCELWDWLFHGEEAFPVLERELTKRYPGIKFVNYKVFGSTHGGGEAKVISSLRDTLKENKCDAVISGIGC